MAVHQMKLTDRSLSKIQSCNKVIELRLFDAKRQKINIGDKVQFTDNNLKNKIETQVAALYRYATFEEMFKDFSPQLFGGNSKEELIAELEQFYSIEDQKQYGVLGIKIILA